MAPVADVDDAAAARIAGGEEPGHLVDRRLRRRQPDPLHRPFGHRGEPLERQGQMRAPAGADHGMDLVDDDRAGRAQHLPAALRREEQVEGFRRGDQDMRRGPQHRRPRRRRRVAGAHRRGDARRRQAGGSSQAMDALARLGQVLVDVGAERLQRRHVDDADLVGQRRHLPFREQAVDRGQKRRQRLARARRRGDERVPAGGNRLPAALLRRRRLTDFSREPVTDDGVETSEGHDHLVEENGARPL